MAGTDETLQRVRDHLQAAGFHYTETDGGEVLVSAGSTAVYVAVEEAGGRQIVLLHAPVLADANPTPEHLGAVLSANAALRFGKFSWNAEARLLSVEYELLGDTLDAEELEVAIHAVSDIADKSDEKLLRLLGGRLPHAR